MDYIIADLQLTCSSEGKKSGKPFRLGLKVVWTWTFRREYSINAMGLKFESYKAYLDQN